MLVVKLDVGTLSLDEVVVKVVGRICGARASAAECCCVPVGAPLPVAVQAACPAAMAQEAC